MRFRDDLVKRDHIGVAELVENVRKLALLRRAIGVDDRPERLRLRRRRFRIERRDVERGEVCRNMAVAAVVVPAPYFVPVALFEIVPRQLGPHDIMPPIVGRKEMPSVK